MLDAALLHPKETRIKPLVIGVSVLAWAVVICSRLQIAASALHGAVWLHYSTRVSGGKQRRLDGILAALDGRPSLPCVVRHAHPPDRRAGVEFVTERENAARLSEELIRRYRRPEPVAGPGDS